MRLARFLRVIVPVILLIAVFPATAFAEVTHENLGEALPLWSCLPFVGMLLSILAYRIGFWRKNLPEELLRDLKG